MNQHKLRLFTVIAFLMGATASILLSLIIAESSYFITNNKCYFSGSSLPVSADESMAFSLYREPFSLFSTKKFRLLAIGGSTTYGFGVDAENTWPHKISAYLSDRFTGDYEVINLGRLGGHLEEFSQNYQASTNVYVPRDKWMAGERPKASDLAKWGWKDLDPDVILLAPVVNDTAPDYLYLAEPSIIARSARRILDAGAKSFFFNKLALGFYVKKSLAVLDLRNRKPVADDEVKLARIREEYKKNLVKFIKLWDNHVRIYLIGLPFLFNEEDGLRHADQAADFWSIPDKSSLRREVHYLPRLEKLERAVRAEVAGELNIPYREIGDEIKKMRFQQRLRLYVDSIHMNARGVNLVADEVFQMIVADDKEVTPRREANITQ